MSIDVITALIRLFNLNFGQMMLKNKKIFHKILTICIEIPGIDLGMGSVS